MCGTQLVCDRREHVLRTKKSPLLLLFGLVCARYRVPTGALTDLASERDEDGEELSLVPDDHAVADARELGFELVLPTNKKLGESKASS